MLFRSHKAAVGDLVDQFQIGAGTSGGRTDIEEAKFIDIAQVVYLNSLHGASHNSLCVEACAFHEREVAIQQRWNDSEFQHAGTTMDPITTSQNCVGVQGPTPGSFRDGIGCP